MAHVLVYDIGAQLRESDGVVHGFPTGLDREGDVRVPYGAPAGEPRLEKSKIYSQIHSLHQCCKVYIIVSSSNFRNRNLRGLTFRNRLTMKPQNKMTV